MIFHHTTVQLGFPRCWERKKHRRKKHINKVLTGLSRDFGGDSVMCFYSPLRNDPKNTWTKFCHPPSPGTIPQICLCLCVFLSLNMELHTSSRNTPETFSQQIWNFHLEYGWRSPNPVLCKGGFHGRTRARHEKSDGTKGTSELNGDNFVSLSFVLKRGSFDSFVVRKPLTSPLIPQKFAGICSNGCTWVKQN